MVSDYYLKKLSKDTTLKIRMNLTKEFRLRRWIFMKLVVLAAWVLGCGLQVDEEKERNT